MSVLKIGMLRAGNIGDKSAPITQINIIDNIDDVYKDLTLLEMSSMYKMQGQKLSDCLFSALPGGTIDALLCEMMKRRSSLFKISFRDKS